MSPRIFISYRTDDVVFAGRIYDALKRRFGEERIFFDQRSIRAGSKWDAEIDRSLAECGVFLLVITPRWLASFAERETTGERDYHLREIELALDRTVPVLPLVIDEADPPTDRLLPAELRGRLPMIQWERIRNDRTFDDSIERLGDQVEWIFEHPSEPEAPPPPPLLPPPPLRPPPARPSANPASPPPPPGPRAATGREPEDLLADRRWRLQHSAWPWALLCCGFATWAAFLYLGFRAKRRDWLIAGAVYLVALMGSTALMQVADDGVQGESSSMENLAFAVYLLVWLVGLIHLAVANQSWLVWRASPEAQPWHAPSRTPPPSTGGPATPF